ncbi:MAG TPA: dicarboxylate/amino acid:cation symporter [Urbifossiella sp.]|jgi:DAACS family dicarboxylate/amino acid:cation (Na+ or H+) symporter|nr:dicarboxylate/amino acid:cation symporter [Urbifossiella sp.]
MASSASVPHTRILVGLIAGAVVGCLVNALTEPPPIPPADALAAAVGIPAAAVPPGPHPTVVWVVKNVTKPVGDVFLNLLFLAIIPLVFASIVLGVTRLGGSANVGRVGAKAVGYFLVTTACAATIGLTLVNVIRPGDYARDQKDGLMAQFGKEAQGRIENAKKKEFGVQTFVDMVPANPLKAAVDKDMLALIVTALLVGFALTRIDPRHAKALTDVFEAVNLVAEQVIRWAMVVAPYAVFCLIFSTTSLFGYKLLIALGAFVLTVLGGLALHQFGVLPVLVKTFGGMSPLDFFRKTQVAILTAFSTSSSSATLPVAIRCAEDELGVPKEVSNFVLPLSASMNHNGTALFESVTVLFLIQVFGRSIGIEEQLVVLVLCILTATGMAGVPGGSLPLIGLILAQFEVPAGAIAIVLGVDRILDMCRTAVNVTADLTTAVYVARSEAGRASTLPTDKAPTAPAERGA